MTSHRTGLGLALAAAAGLAALTPPAAALAQQYNAYDQGQTYDQARRDYDARYGPGAYDRFQAERRDYDAQHGPGAYDRDYGGQAYRQDDRAAQQACQSQKRGNQVAGGLLGGLAGAVLGSNLAHGGGRTGGAVIGGVGGAALGAGIAGGQTHCNQ